jgi:quinol monooxygenase YgiN
MIIILAKFTYPSSDVAQQAFADAREGTALSQQGEGVLWYTHALCTVDPNVLWAIHVWERPEDVDRHVGREHYPALNDAVTKPAVNVEVKQWVGMEAYLRTYRDYDAPVALADGRSG